MQIHTVVWQLHFDLNDITKSSARQENYKVLGMSAAKLN